MRRRLRKERGVAIMMVIIAITILTALATEFTYNSRVDTQLAVNYRDEIRAYYLARSGIAMSRLVLTFQKQIDSMNLGSMMSGLQGLLGGAAGGGNPLAALTGAAGGAAGGAQAGGSISINLYEMAKIDCHMLQALMPQSDGLEGESMLEKPSSLDQDSDAPAPDEPETRSFGGFEGCFQTTIQSEDSKINLNRIETSGQATGASIVAPLLAVLRDQRFDFLFSKPDSNGVKVTPEELLENIRDWVDENQTRSALSPLGVFADAYSDENGQYSRYRPKYLAKNFRFDTLDELYMVHGVNDAVMAALKDRLTVYTDINEGLNINSNDPLVLYLAVLTVAYPPNQSALQNPMFVNKLVQSIQSRKIMPFLGLGVSDFLTIVETEGITVNPQLRQRTNGVLTNKRSAYTIKAVGEAGSVRKTITTVVNTSGPGELGQLVYWREE